MINLYATPYEIKSQLGDGINQTVAKYDAAFIKMVAGVSRLIDNLTGRQFYPSFETRYYDGSGLIRQWIDDLISLDKVYYSDDNGQSYIEQIVNTDFFLTRAGNRNNPAAYNYLVGNLQSSRNYYPKGQNSVKISGWWGYTEDRAYAWLSADTLGAAITTTTATSITVSDADGFDAFGVSPRFQQGHIIKIDNELMAVALVDPAENKLTVIRGLNGSTAATHLISAPVLVWQTPKLAGQACVMQTVRTINRAWQGFADGRATPELGGQVLWVKRLDPEVITFLETMVSHL